jgi:hypothetical protein
VWAAGVPVGCSTHYQLRTKSSYAKRAVPPQLAVLNACFRRNALTPASGETGWRTSARRFGIDRVEELKQPAQHTVLPGAKAHVRLAPLDAATIAFAGSPARAQRYARTAVAFLRQRRAGVPTAFTERRPRAVGGSFGRIAWIFLDATAQERREIRACARAATA